MIVLMPETALIRSHDRIATDMDGDTVVMSIERGECFGIGGIGSKVWELLAQPPSLAQLTEAICADYEVDAATCKADLQKFERELLENGLAVLA